MTSDEAMEAIRDVFNDRMTTVEALGKILTILMKWERSEVKRGAAPYDITKSEQPEQRA